MRGEGEEEEEESCNLKVLKTGCFTMSVSSSFLSPFDILSGEKKRNWQCFLYMGRVGEGEGKEEGSCNLKALKTGCFIISVSSSFLYSSDSFSGEKQGNWQSFLYRGRVMEGEGKEEGVCCLRRCFIGSV